MSYEGSISKQAIDLVERFARCLLQEGKRELNIPAVKQLASYITYYDNFSKLSTKEDEIFRKFLDKVDPLMENLDFERITDEFLEEIEKAKSDLEGGKKCAKYEEFMNWIEESLDSNESFDEEVKTVCESVNTVDPITKLPIVEPVKNKICGHTYEKRSILQLIANNSKTKCPIPGCSVTDFVKKSDLVPDNALKRFLSQTEKNATS